MSMIIRAGVDASQGTRRSRTIPPFEGTATIAGDPGPTEMVVSGDAPSYAMPAVLVDVGAVQWRVRFIPTFNSPPNGGADSFVIGLGAYLGLGSSKVRWSNGLNALELTHSGGTTATFLSGTTTWLAGDYVDVGVNATRNPTFRVNGGAAVVSSSTLPASGGWGGYATIYLGIGPPSTAEGIWLGPALIYPPRILNGWATA